MRWQLISVTVTKSCGRQINSGNSYQDCRFFESFWWPDRRQGYDVQWFLLIFKDLNLIADADSATVPFGHWCVAAWNDAHYDFHNVVGYRPSRLSLSLWLCLSVSHFLCLHVCVCVCLSVYLAACACLFVFVRSCLCMCVCVWLASPSGAAKRLRLLPNDAAFFYNSQYFSAFPTFFTHFHHFLFRDAILLIKNTHCDRQYEISYWVWFFILPKITPCFW